jgi:hypothetical protein
MAEEKYESRELNLRNSLPWLELFRGFQIAIDPRKLLLAAAGIFVMSLGWWALSYVFDTRKPDWDDYRTKALAKASESKDSDEKAALAAEWGKYRADLDDWNVRHRAAGAADSNDEIEAGDVADNYQEFVELQQLSGDKKEPAGSGSEITPSQAARDKAALYRLTEPKGKRVKKVSGEMRTLPWSENRGPNPALLLAHRSGGAEAGHVIDWLVSTEAPVLLEPLYKFLRPVVYFLHPKAGFLTRIYFLLIIVWTLAVWSLFGGAITRMAAVELARREKVGIADAVKFAYRRWLSYFFAPLFPLIFVAILVVVTMIPGVIDLIPIVGEIVNGILWPIILVLGLLMAVVLVGLVGWPMMSATISTEGTDSWEAVSRSYSYIFSAAWHYIWYSVVAILYGAIVVLFVGFMGSLTVYLGRWALAQTPFSSKLNREPSFLFVYTPTSFGWRELLLTDGRLEGQPLVSNGEINAAAYDKYTGRDTSYDGPDRMKWYNQVGAWLVGFWVSLFFLMIVGFGYSYFWTASTIIYLLMRKKVDDAELDEVYLEEEEHDGFFTPPKPTAPAPPPPTAPVGKTTSSLQMVEAPSLRLGATQPGQPASAPPPTQAGASTGAPAAPPPTSSSNPGNPGSSGGSAVPHPSGDGNAPKNS